MQRNTHSRQAGRMKGNLLKAMVRNRFKSGLRDGSMKTRGGQGAEGTAAEQTGEVAMNQGIHQLTQTQLGRKAL